MLTVNPGSLVPALLLLSISLSAHADWVQPRAPMCCDEMPVSCRSTPCKKDDMYDCSKGCLRTSNSQTFPCELKQPSDFERAMTNSTAAVEYFKAHGLLHVESISRSAHISGACEISASTTSRVSFKGRTYSFYGPYLASTPRGETAVRGPTLNISDFTKAIDAAENDRAVQTVQKRVKDRLIAQTSQLNVWGETVGVRHVYRLAFGATCHPGDMGLYYEYDVAKRGGWLKFYKFPVDMLAGQGGFEEINRLVNMPEYRNFMADGKDNHCIIVETVDARGKFGLPSKNRVPEVELWKPGKGLRLVIR